MEHGAAQTIRCLKCLAGNRSGDTHCCDCGARLPGRDDLPTLTSPVPMAAAPDPSPLLSSSKFTGGTVLLDRYRLEEFLGEGSMGKVFRAYDLKLEVQVALKFLHRELLTDQSMIKLFYNEARTARRVVNAYLCQVYDIGEVEKRPFLSMEYLNGGSLFDLLRAGETLPMEQALKTARQLCLGLATLHLHGILHRDLKPANIMLNSDRDVRITDFGLAGLAAEIAKQERQILGTLSYMAPEQITMGETSQQSDLFSLGLILYEIFASRRAYQARTILDAIEERKKTLTLPSHLRKGLDPALDKIVQRCLEPEPERRPPASEVYQAIVDLGDVDRLEVAAAAEARSKHAPRRVSEEMTEKRVPSDRSPFLSSREVTGADFLGRDFELRTIFSRIYNGESSAIVGGPRSGKSSLLSKLTETDVRELFLRDLSNRLTFYRLDLQAVPGDFTPADFWKECLEPLQDARMDPTLGVLLERAEEARYKHRQLKNLFDHLGENGQRLVLLLDDLEELTARPGFREESQFFALLRVLATKGNLTLILASRLSVKKLNERFPSGESGSPHFNHMFDVRLKPFKEITVKQLMQRAGERFSPADRGFIRCVAGRHPYLLQVLSATMFVEIQSDIKRVQAAREFYHQVVHFFEETWQAMDDEGRAALILLGLAELAGRAVRRSPGYLDAKPKHELGLRLNELADAGLAEKMESDQEPYHEFCLTWREQKWALGAHALLWWIWELVVVESRRFPPYNDWLKGEKYRYFLTLEEWQNYQEQARKMSDSTGHDVESMIQEISNNFFGGDS